MKSYFNFEKEKLIKELKKRKPKKVLVQLPEGIKKNSLELAELINKLGIEVVFSGETCWGGCSLPIQTAKNINADLIIHFGHSELIKKDFPIIYIEVIDKFNFKKILEKSMDFLKNYNVIGLSYSVQHKNEIKKIISFYEKNNKKIILSKKNENLSYEGQIIGCNYSGLKQIEKKVDAFLVLGNRFHSIGASLSTEKPVFLLDVYNNEIKKINEIKNKIIKQRFFCIEKLKKAKKVGVLVSEKIGQQFGSSEFLYNELKKKGKKTIIISIDEITPEKLFNFYDIDVFIELACPRIAIDDFEKYKKPLLTFKESLVALKKLSWEDFLSQGIL